MQHRRPFVDSIRLDFEPGDGNTAFAIRANQTIFQEYPMPDFDKQVTVRDQTHDRIKKTLRSTTRAVAAAVDEKEYDEALEELAEGVRSARADIRRLNAE